jgi:hypothetical protein
MRAAMKRASPTLKETEFPNLEAERAFDREEHIRRAMLAGMDRAQAERHADEDMAERDER